MIKLCSKSSVLWVSLRQLQVGPLVVQLIGQVHNQTSIDCNFGYLRLNLGPAWLYTFIEIILPLPLDSRILTNNEYSKYWFQLPPTGCGLAAEEEQCLLGNFSCLFVIC